MSGFLQICFGGFALGAVYALVALGFVVIYRSSQIFNFAHGELVAIGAFCMTTFVSIGMPWPLALLMAMSVTGLLAAGIERAIIRPMIGRPLFSTIILTLFVGFLLRAAILIIWGTDLRGMPTPWDTMASVEIGGAVILYNGIIAVVLGGIALVLFYLLLKKTRLGIAMRAANSDQEVALVLGIPVGKVFMTTWFLAGAFAALAGVFLTMFPRSLDANLGYVALAAFPAAVVGGLNSPIGTVIAGVLLGMTEVLAQAYLEPLLGEFGHNIHVVFPYIIMIFFLMVRPYGLFGQKVVERL
ncbi:MAG: branched-chain amino acid ABC transporter permease [Kofleriaceae bacterium]|nr:branched-chain amino acid ABC transporter permease [Kofleriaceae bacterium]